MKEEKTTLSPEAIEQLIKENKALKSRIDEFDQRSPILGVRWYGRGSYLIGLSSMVNGVNKVILKGYGDKAAIDLNAWMRLQNTKEVKNGILVRDDTVVEELSAVGRVAENRDKDNPNSFTDNEIASILKNKTVKQLAKIVDECTDHFPIGHFLTVASRIGLEDLGKISLLEKRYDLLFAYHRWSVLHEHDLNDACERLGYDFEHMDRDEKIEALVKREME